MHQIYVESVGSELNQLAPVLQVCLRLGGRPEVEWLPAVSVLEVEQKRLAKELRKEPKTPCQPQSTNRPTR